MSRAPRKCDCVACLYCDMPLAPSHEHDHFPVPKHLGGEDVFGVCKNCHSLKDRLAFTSWDASAALAAIAGLDPIARILTARFLRLYYETEAKARELDRRIEGMQE